MLFLPPHAAAVLLLAGDSGNEEDAGAGSLFLHTGLSNGVLLRTEMDRVTGAMSDTRTRFLGTRAPKLFTTSIRGQRAMLALSSRPWLGYSHNGRFNLNPLSYEVRLALTKPLPDVTETNRMRKATEIGRRRQRFTERGRVFHVLCHLPRHHPLAVTEGRRFLCLQALDYADSFASDQCPEGFVAVSNSTLRIITLERLAETFNQARNPLLVPPHRNSTFCPFSPERISFSTRRALLLRCVTPVGMRNSRHIPQSLSTQYLLSCLPGRSTILQLPSLCS